MRRVVLIVLLLVVILGAGGCLSERGIAQQNHGLDLRRADELVGLDTPFNRDARPVYAQAIYQREILMELQKQTKAMERIADALEIIANQ